jgi:DNA-binding GntR family transcriptional regulator
MGKNPPLRYVIYRELLEDLLTGRLNSGEKLREAELAERFHVSRTPIREALVQLEREGFIAHSQNVGAVVRKISAVQVDETFEMVALLEVHATRIAVAKMKDEDISFLTRLHQSMQKSAKEERFPDWVKLNADFHDFFVEKCGNKRLRETVLDLRKSIYRVIVEGQTLPRKVGEYLLSHQGIIEAAAKRDSAEAAELMNAHVLATKKYVLEAYDRFNRAPALKIIPERWH